MTTDWLERAAWSLRSPEFGDLSEDAKGVVMAFPGTPKVTVSEPLWELWRQLPAHPNILEAVATKSLRYAALDWQCGPVAIADDPDAAADIATRGYELTWICEFLYARVPTHSLAWMACPIVKFDLEGEIRIAFITASSANPRSLDRLPPEAVDRWPQLDKRGLVFVVGQLLRSLIVDGHRTPLGRVIEGCLEPKPTRRIASLDEVRHALRDAGARRRPPFGLRPKRLAWNELEQGIGHLALGQPVKALMRFERALQHDPGSQPARELRDLAIHRGADPIRGTPEPMLTTPRKPLAWSEGAATALVLEQERDFAAALETYRAVRLEDADLIALETAMARCHLRLGAFAKAIELADRALRRAPDHEEAVTIRIDAMLRKWQYIEALEATDAWLLRAPDAPHAHYVRGKSLLGLKRLLEARDAFDRACALRPEYLEAMLLRREADRSLRGLRAAVGTAAAMTLDVPAHLAELRSLLATGRVDDGILMLRRAAYERDAAAQLALAELLSFDRRFDEALAVFERAAELGTEHRHAALLGQARTLLELDRAEQALAVFDLICADRADLVEAIEGRARALVQLGRGAEAEDAFRRYTNKAMTLS